MRKTVVGTLIIICIIFSIHGFQQTFLHQEKTEVYKDYLWNKLEKLQDYAEIGFSISPFISNILGIEENDNEKEILEKMLPLVENNGLVCRYFAPLLFSELIRRGHVCSLEIGVFELKYNPDNPSATYILWIHDEGFYKANHVWVRLENGDILDFWKSGAGRYTTYASIYDVEWENGRWQSRRGGIFPENILRVED